LSESELILVAPVGADVSISTSFSLLKNPQEWAASTTTTPVDIVGKNDGSNKNDADIDINIGMVE
jgi:hypothetical protein